MNKGYGECFMKLSLSIAGLLVILFFSNAVLAQNTDDYLILSDIGPYKLDRPEKLLPGRGPIGGPEILDLPGGVGIADHYNFDHIDKMYKVMYIGGNGIPSPTVYVTKHAGSDSDRWLLHEIEDRYRDGDDTDGRFGLLSSVSVKIRQIASNKIIYWGFGGGHYTWISGHKVIELKYTDLQMKKPEPLEIIQAYLQKHPSTIPSSYVMDRAHDEKWIKDEMERRLWLCDKWFIELQTGNMKQLKVLKEIVNSMMIFLNYREHFYRKLMFIKIKASDDKMRLSTYLAQEDTASIKTTLEEYKKWWLENKDKSISL